MPLARGASFAERICRISLLSVFCKFLFLLSFCDCNIFISRRFLVAFVLCLFVVVFLIMFPAFAAFGCLQRICAAGSPAAPQQQSNSHIFKAIKVIDADPDNYYWFFESAMCA